jgi:hypothetical protein
MPSEKSWRNRMLSHVMNCKALAATVKKKKKRKKKINIFYDVCTAVPIVPLAVGTKIILSLTADQI